MIAHLLSLWDRVRTSLWALPLAMALAGAALAPLALSSALPENTTIAWLYGGDAQDAQAFAAALIGAMITLTTLAISITMVVLTLAAQQLGPRLIQIFMSDLSTKFSLGFFLGSNIYLLLLLRALDGNGAEDNTPTIAVTLGTALVILSLVTLLFFVHGLARSIVSDHVIARVGQILDDEIATVFTAVRRNTEARAPEGGEPISLNACGYVQRINYESLVSAAHKHNAYIMLTYHPGGHILAAETDAWVIADTKERDKLAKALSSNIVIAPERTIGQDPIWSARQLVEIALRALSPGINDDFTALAVIDRLTASLSHLMQSGVYPSTWSDKDGVARVFGPAPDFGDILDAAFDQIRVAGAHKQRILLNMAQNLARLAALAETPHAPALRRHVGLLQRTSARAIADDLEREEILEPLQAAEARLAALC